ncbi:MAG: hypothetical protein M3299_13975, partial [Thermoproteota archaeon]|nr:hypothetical protein [Thermoproteota archaeon]
GEQAYVKLKGFSYVLLYFFFCSNSTISHYCTLLLPPWWFKRESYCMLRNSRFEPSHRLQLSTDYL